VVDGYDVDGPAAQVILDLVEPVLRHRLATGRGFTAAERKVLDGLRVTARAWATGDRRGFPVTTTVASGRSQGATSWCTTAEASQRLDMSRQAVRKAIARGALVARQPTAGGPYLVDEQSIARFEAARLRNPS